MTVDREVRSETDPPTGPDPASEPVSRATLLAYAVVAALLVGWVLFGWLVQRQGIVDSLGEGLGAAFTLLLIVSVVGSIRRHRRHE
ncbi:hypothetical protein ACN27G_27000 [Plantactinospora sp. WMMB334]|uniref:hypothetical protein n=1 Tax=Plantactinospora sp. WMMB334 TaxID=3404119 RepID=UPI003B92D074